MGCCKSKPKGEGDSELKSSIEGKKKVCIWILGGPGSGKGTQCAALADRFKLAHLSTGDLLRNIMHEDTSLARDIRSTMERGELVDTPTVLQLLTDAMTAALKTHSGFLIDGFPRDVQQGELFCQKIGAPHVIIYLECSDEVLTDRLIQRGLKSGRVDDNEETIQLRLKTFHNVSQPLINHWTEKVIKIDGSQDPAEVTQECIAAIQKMEGFKFS